MTASGVQAASGYSGYRLDGTKLTKEQAQARINNAQGNMSLAFTGMSLGMSAMDANGKPLSTKDKGASGVKFGDSFGKIGTYAEKPNLKVDWKQYADHAINDSMVKRGITQEMVDSYVANGKALSQGNGKYAFVSRDGVAVVASNGKLVTTWSSTDFDANMLDIIDKLFGKGK